MKNLGFRQKTLEEVKATQASKLAKKKLDGRKSTLKAKKPAERKKTANKVKSKTQTQLKKALSKKLWELCKEVVRKRDGNICVICGKQNLSGSGWHTGHLIPRSTCGALLRYDIRNLHSSCYYCNINLGGNGAMYLVALSKKYTPGFIENLFFDKEKYTKDDHLLLQSKILEYEQIRGWDKDKLFNYTKNYQAP